MKTYKAPDNSLHCIEPEFVHLLPDGCVEISQEELEAIYESRKVVQPITDPEQLEALAYLSSTDWYVTRFAETGKEIPTEISEKRAAARELI